MDNDDKVHGIYPVIASPHGSSAKPYLAVMTDSPSIPILDLDHYRHGSKSKRAAFVRLLGQALEQIGFFALENHGVDRNLIQQAYRCAEAFFALPDGTKQTYELPQLHGQRGFTRFGREHAKDHPVPDLKEFWHVGREGDPRSGTSPLLPNVWPAELPDFQPTMTGLYQQLDACGEILLEACALYLGQPKQRLAQMTTHSDTILRVIHYPPIPPDAPVQSLRSAPHEDINLITLLCEATEPGLELLQANGEWLPIPAIPGQIIVDTGDMLQNLTNGLFKSTTHRVSNPECNSQTDPDGNRHRRFSMPFFIHPRANVDLTPLPECVARTGGIPRYPSLTAGEYLTQRLQEIGLIP